MTTTDSATASAAYVLQQVGTGPGSYAEQTYADLESAIADANRRRSAGTLEGRFRVLNLATGAVELEWLR